jgi:Cu-Zn family superoxide dismutase
MFYFVGGLVIILILVIAYKSYYKKPKKLTKALSIIEGNGIKGLVYLDELWDGNTHVYGKIVGLSPGKHAFHIHESGNMMNGCNSLGGHYNPFGKRHGSRVTADSNGNVQINYDRHVGDLGNIITNKKGETMINFVDPLVKLIGETSVIGRSIVIHVGVDDYGKGGTADSLKTGSAGGRLACGIIALA